MESLIHRSKAWFLSCGILLILAGIVSVALPLFAAIAIELLAGWILAISGFIQIIHSFRASSAGICVLRLITGIVYLAVGVIFLVLPMEGILTLTLLLAVLFTSEGIIKVLIALQAHHQEGKGLIVLSAAASLIIAAIIWAGWPGTSTWAIGVLVGVNLIFGGSTLVIMSGFLPDTSIRK